MSWFTRLENWIEDFLVNVYHDPIETNAKTLPMNQEPIAVQPPVTTAPAPKYLWDTVIDARYSVRLIADEEGLTVAEKNLICACIQQESNFKNTAVGRNYKDGKLLSTDWGIVQVNDYWNIGLGKRWTSVQQVLDNPDKAVKWMIACYKQGNLSMWASYSSGAYKKFMSY